MHLCQGVLKETKIIPYTVKKDSATYHMNILNLIATHASHKYMKLYDQMKQVANLMLADWSLV